MDHHHTRKDSGPQSAVGHDGFSVADSTTTLLEAVRALAGVCDGAVTRDGAGFNGTDAAFGRSLARLPEGAWDDATRRVAWEVLGKYRGQLAAHGIDYTAIPIPPPTTTSRREAAVVVSKTIEVEADVFVIRFRYDPVLVDRVKTIPGRRFTNRGTEKFWIAPLSSAAAVVAFAEANGFKIVGDVPVVENIANKAPSTADAPLPSNKGSVVVEGAKFIIRFGEHPGQEALDTIRAIPRREYHGPEKLWKVPVRGNGAAVLALAKRFGLSIAPEVEAEIAEIEAKAKALRDASVAADADFHVDGLAMELRPYQRAGVSYMSQVRRGFIADEPGLGKTAQSIAAVVHANAFPVVCVVPFGMKINWKREWEMWVPGINVQILSGYKGGQISKMFPPQVIVINYNIVGRVDADTGTLWGHLADLVAIKPKALIADEAHWLKTPKANRTLAVKHLAQAIPKDGLVLALTGTPLVNRPAELVSQLDILGRLSEFGGASRFKTRYCLGTERCEALLPELNDRLRASCMVRRLKKDVLKELPAKTTSLVPMETDPKIMAQYAKAEADVVSFLARRAMELALESGLDEREAQRAFWEKKMKASAAEQLVLISTLKILAARAKLPHAISWVKEFLASDSKLVLFADHREIVDALVDAFPGAVKIQGGQTMADRDAAVQRFQNDPDCRLVVCSMGAGGVGLTLTAASDVAFLEQGWTPAVHAQCEDRTHRIGQRDAVTAWYLLADGTIDQRIAQLISEKKRVVDAVTDGTDPSAQDNSSVLGQLLVDLANQGLAKGVAS